MLELGPGLADALAMKSIMSSEEMAATNHSTLGNGWKVVTETSHVWKWNAARNRWENWR